MNETMRKRKHPPRTKDQLHRRWRKLLEEKCKIALLTFRSEQRKCIGAGDEIDRTFDSFDGHLRLDTPRATKISIDYACKCFDTVAEDAKDGTLKSDYRRFESTLNEAIRFILNEVDHRWSRTGSVHSKFQKFLSKVKGPLLDRRDKTLILFVEATSDNEDQQSSPLSRSLEDIVHSKEGRGGSGVTLGKPFVDEKHEECAKLLSSIISRDGLESFLAKHPQLKRTSVMDYKAGKLKGKVSTEKRRAIEVAIAASMRPPTKL